jgi:hypothetical protein
VAVLLAMPRPLLVVEEPDAVILLAESLNHGSRRIGHSVADDEDLQFFDRLSQCAGHRVTEGRTVVVRRNHHCGSKPKTG